MKRKTLLFFFSFLFVLSTKAQTLTVLELLQLSNKPDWESVNSYLVNKGWEYYNSKEGDNESYNIVGWSFEKSSYNDKAQGWFHLYTYTGYPNKVSYQFHNKVTYNTIKNTLASNGFKYIDSEIKDDEVISKYANPFFIILLSYIKSEQEDYSESSHTTYLVTVIKKAGVYDVDNGLKKSYDSYGNLESEYTLKDSKLNGTAKSYYSNGKLKIVSNFISGTKQGASKEYDEDGNLTGEYNYVNGEASGSYEIYENGKLKLIGTLSDGKKNGQFKEYDEDGNLTGEYNYVKGEASGSYKIYENGKLKLIGTLYDGKKNGQFKVYDEDGNLDREYVMKDDELNGNYIEYYYKDNKLILKNSGQYLADVKSGLWQVVKFKEKEPDLLSSHNYLNGEYDGTFKEVSSDSIIFGSYQNGILNGKYKIYTSLWSYLGGEVTGDTSGAILTTSGSYFNGQKSGYWKYYSLTKVLRKEGSYSDDVKTGEWKYYYDNILKSDAIDEYEPYSKQLYLSENYENGKLNGKSVQTSSLETIPILCDTSKFKSKSPLDTCYTSKYEKFYQVAYYKNGELHGPMEYKDSAGVIRYKGTFINGLKDGPWTESYESNNTDSEQFYVYDRGNYLNGKKTGIWDEYVNEDFVFTKYNYSNGKLNGKTVDFNSQHKPKEEKYFEDGNFKTLNIFDSIGNNIIRKYEIINTNDRVINCIRTTFKDSIQVSQGFQFISSMEKFNVNFFEFDFILSTMDTNSIVKDNLLATYNSGSKKLDKPSKENYLNNPMKYETISDKDIYSKGWKYEGVYLVKNSKTNEIYIEGNYKNHLKQGEFKIYYYDVNVYTEQDFASNVGGVEKYFVINTGQPFSGKFIQNYENGKPKYEFKISEGLRDGKSKYFDESGETIRTEKYDKGIIKL